MNRDEIIDQLAEMKIKESQIGTRRKSGWLTRYLRENL